MWQDFIQQVNQFGKAKTPFFFNDMPQTFQIGLYHSWAVNEQNFPTALQITARCDDNIIMAMQHKTLPIYGVQFHPESYISEYGEQILRNWLQES